MEVPKNRLTPNSTFYFLEYVVTYLQAFLGIVNYVGPFVPYLSQNTSILRELPKNDAVFHEINSLTG